MANQTKNYRKFVATSVTAALVASAVAPAAFAAEKVDFKDSIPTWAKDAVDYLVGKEAISGYPDGTFNQAGKLTRAEAAKILALSLDLKIDEDAKTDFADAKDHWASKYIAAIQKEKPGVIDGYNGKFDPNANITRQQMAKMVVVAYDLKLDEAADISFSDNNGWGADQVNILASLGVVEGVSAGKFSPNADVTRGQAAVFVHRTEVESVRVEVATKDAKVVSVNAINAKELVVKFNTAVKKSSVVETSGANVGTLVDGIIKVDGASADSYKASLSEDGKELTITAATSWEGTHSVEVLANKVVSTKNLNVPQYAVAFTFADTVRATITGVEYVNKYTYKVKFSEPVQSVGTVGATFADGTAVTLNTSATGYGLSNDGKSFTVALDSATAANKEISVSFPAIKDFANNVSIPSSAKLTISDADQTKPAVSSVVATSPTSLKIKFTESIDLLDASKITFNGTTTGVSVLADANDDTVLNVTVPATTTSGILALTAGAVEDLNKNQNAAFSQTVSFAYDKVAPTVVNTEVVRVSGVNNLKITMSEEVTKVGTTLQLKYTDDYGVTQNVTIPTGNIDVDSTDGKVVYVVLHDGTNAVKEAINYSVTIPAGYFQDGFTNPSVSKSISFLNSTTSTTSKLALITTNPVVNGIDANGAYVEVRFAAAVNASSATNVANYAVEGATVTNAVLTYNNPTSRNGDGANAVVRAYFKDNTVLATGNYNVTVNGIIGYNSSVTQMASTTNNIQIQENVRPTVKSAAVKSFSGANTVVSLTFSEAIASDTVPNGDFDLYVDGVKVSSATVTNGALGTTIDFTIGANLSADLGSGKSVKLVATSAIDLKDAAGNLAEVTEVIVK